MKGWSADKIVAVGVTIVLILTIIGADFVAVIKGDMETIASLGKEIVIGFFGYMGGRGSVKNIKPQGVDKS